MKEKGKLKWLKLHPSSLNSLCIGDEYSLEMTEQRAEYSLEIIGLSWMRNGEWM